MNGARGVEGGSPDHVRFDRVPSHVSLIEAAQSLTRSAWAMREASAALRSFADAMPPDPDKDGP